MDLMLIPPGLEVGSTVLLLAVSTLTSLITAMLGLGGGLVLLAVMAALLPVSVLIPVHGLVQLGSNGGRALLMHRSVSPRLTGWFLPGALLGVGLASLWVVALPESALSLLLALYILYSTWGPALPRTDGDRRAAFGVGLFSSLLSMFVGATGPLVATLFSRRALGRETVVATHAACMTLQHALKIAAFGVLGFSFQPWLGFIALMIGTGFIGTLVGRHLLLRLNDRYFQRLFRALLTLLALHLAISALLTFSA